MGKRKASVRIEDSNWSEPFTLDTIEDAGRVTCKSKISKSDVFNVGVNINLSKSSLTKIITFTPFFLIHNTTELNLDLWELESLDVDEDCVNVGPGQMVPFWPAYGANHVSVFLSGLYPVHLL
jgi:vacuolar protein sorting-associated protein 13A/C